eukprot:m.155744 g.155744  ORF g.155744 m.155744 type:complete len:286 (+) comp20814_c2_seq2:77-934(+)
MFSSLQTLRAAGPQNVRGMATLKELSMRLKSVTSIQKITKSMKMVSAAKYARAEAALKEGRALGVAASALAEKGEITAEDGDKRIIIAMSSDRGLCGGVHSGIAKRIKKMLKESAAETKVVAYGDKLRGRMDPKNLLVSANDVGKKPPQFSEASFVAQTLLDSGFDFKSGQVVYNHYRSAVSYEVRTKPVLSLAAVEGNDKMSIYDDVDSDTLQDYMEFNLACSMYYAALEQSTSEQSARMSAMENATKNAGEMIDKLRLTFNRTRQAVITRELIEIISGAAALD